MRINHWVVAATSMSGGLPAPELIDTLRESSAAAAPSIECPPEGRPDGGLRSWLARRLAAWRERWRADLALEQMDAHMLADIGLTRGDRNHRRDLDIRSRESSAITNWREEDLDALFGGD